MRIGELARRSGIRKSRIRFYEKHGLVQSASRGENGYREYAPSDLERLTTILDAQELGFTLAEIRELTAQLSRGAALPGVVVPALEGKIADLDARISALTKVRQRMATLLEEERKCIPAESDVSG
ncbi:MerR family transcriptional regulator [Devosia sp. SL43]|uniref:MerR family transcriptional regulator n=1 Tax=Devosia sp. SL43 TaxID=2806348 RepID=UPI001F02E844|nr:MerR family transcriptional regulator [Devosia sp. SL43]UJW87878.1 MerR family transcriptional regulator [Devosia sp. SL43]